MQKANMYLLLPLAFWSMVAGASDYQTLFTSKALDDAAAAYYENINYNWNEELVARLPDDHRQQASLISLRQPRVGVNRSPFDFYADAGFRRVYIPTMSVKFLDDVATAWTWLELSGCNSATVFDYIGMIRHQDFPSKVPAPFEALPIPANPLSNQQVYDDSGKILKSALYFIMAHELGHVMHGHSAAVGFADSQQQEIDADAYALAVMRRLSVMSEEPVPPMGMVVFFRAVSRFELSPADFDSIGEFEAYVRQGATHPLTSARLITMANTIRKYAHDFAGGQLGWTQRINSIADDIAGIGEILDDRKFRTYQRNRSRATTRESLLNACN